MSLERRVQKLEAKVRMLESENVYDSRLISNVEDAMQIIADKLGMSLGELYEGLRGGSGDVRIVVRMSVSGDSTRTGMRQETVR